MLSDPATAQPWLQWWRSVLQWVGAIGVIVFAVTFAEPSGDHDTLVSAEWGQHPGSHASETARRLVATLATITAVSTAALIVVGEPVWRSINHGMTAAATGGFVITSQSVASTSGAARLILAVALLISAVSFGTIWDRVTRHGVPLWKRTQIRYGLAATLICMFGAIVTSHGVALQDLAFNSISASTTGGFSAGTSYRTVEALAVIAMLSMFIGGAAGSTAGGIKAARLAWLAKAAGRWLPGRSETHDEDETYRWDDDEVGRDDRPRPSRPPGTNRRVGSLDVNRDSSRPTSEFGETTDHAMSSSQHPSATAVRGHFAWSRCQRRAMTSAATSGSTFVQS